MEVETKYLTFEEYSSLGGTLTEMPFNLLEIEARKKIDKYTFNRLVNLETQDNLVKGCMFKLIETINGNGNYLDAKTIEKENIERQIITDYLFNYKVNDVDVLFCGVE